MNRTAITAVAASLGLALAAPAQADSSVKESVGVGLGALIGAMAGGPAGFVLGAVSGGYVGDRWHAAEAGADGLSESLAGANTRMVQLQAEVDALTSDLDELGAELMAYEKGPARTALELLSAGIEMDILFRTDEAATGPDSAARLAELARFLVLVPDVRIRLDGYADPRGAAEYNEALSVRRAESIRDIMLEAGIPAEQIDLVGHGAVGGEETLADNDALALERRVTVRFFLDHSLPAADRIAEL